MIHHSHIVKRGGRIESYEQKKLASSVIAACLSVRTPVGSAELTARSVCHRVEDWLHHKPEVTSDDLRRKTAEALEEYNPEAAFYYRRHPYI